MEKSNHAHPVFTMTKTARPGDRETRMHPAPGKWIVRHEQEKEAGE